MIAMPHKNRSFFSNPAILLLLVMVCFSSLAAAQGAYPAKKQILVNDLADVMSDEEETSASQIMVYIRNPLSLPVYTVVINSINDYQTTSTTTEQFTSNLFSAWGMPEEAKRFSLVLLVTTADQRQQLLLGSELHPQVKGELERVLQMTMRDDLQQKKFGLAVVKGVAAIAGTLTTIAENARKAQEQAQAQQGGGDAATPDPNDPRLKLARAIRIGGIAVFVLALLALGVVMATRTKKTACPNCGHELTALESAPEVLRFASGTPANEKLTPEEFDMRHCPACEWYQIDQKGGMFAGYADCPQCKSQTVEKTAELLEAATVENEGKAKLIEACQNCEYRAEDVMVLPRLKPVEKTEPAAEDAEPGLDRED